MFVALGETTDLIEVIRTPKFTWGNQVVNNPKGKEGNHMGSRMDMMNSSLGDNIKAADSKGRNSKQ